MENNEIVMLMDVKIDKRPECTRFQQWTKSQVKIEAVKCLPSFLRISFQETKDEIEISQTPLSISIIVPGVALTLASSRTKQHSYAIYWTQNRKNCYIYFALDTELSCRRHMKWMRKSIKNLELHRKLLLEERRISRGVTGGISAITPIKLPTLEDLNDTNEPWSQRVSEIYEEIFEGNEQELRRVSRRCSHTSIASGIYEEMKLPSDSPFSFDAIDEQIPTTPVTPTPPPLPPLRKRFNTFETQEVGMSPLMDPIPRCSTNPETEMAKKKKYKNVLDNIFHGSGLRSKRTVSASESSQEQIPQASGTSTGTTPKNLKTKLLSKVKSTEVETPKNIRQTTTIKPTTMTATTSSKDEIPLYANDDIISAKRQKKPMLHINEVQSKRNSFSSPDLSKINFVDTFDEQRIADLLNPSFLKYEDLDLASSASMDGSDSLILPLKIKDDLNLQQENQNISARLPNNFNFSACNSSAINLIAPLNTKKKSKQPKNKIILDDLTGYCVMAPIVKKMSAIDNTIAPVTTVRPLESVSSGYSTGSYCSSTSSTEEQLMSNATKSSKASKTNIKVSNNIAEESAVYMNMHAALEDSISSNEQQRPLRKISTPPLLVDEFSGNLYENLLTVKAARELELEHQAPHKSSAVLSTSTPTESPLLPETAAITPTSTKFVITTEEEEEENYYQTPRKSIISIDDKVPSYYPNNCESTAKSSRRGSYSPAKVQCKNLGTSATETTPTAAVSKKSPVSLKLQRERKENLYQTTPPNTTTGSTNTTGSTAKTSKSKKTAAHKISENVYAVKHRFKKSTPSQTVAAAQTETDTVSRHSSNNNNNNNNNNIEKRNSVQEEILPLGILQHIDFKFEDVTKPPISMSTKDTKSPKTPKDRLLLSPTHHLKVNQSENTCHHSGANSPTTTSSQEMTQSTLVNVAAESMGSGNKKFASLPRFKKFDFSPLRMRINNVLQRHYTPDL